MSSHPHGKLERLVPAFLRIDNKPIRLIAGMKIKFAIVRA